jgi:hypothetical protein
MESIVLVEMTLPKNSVNLENLVIPSIRSPLDWNCSRGSKNRH